MDPKPIRSWLLTHPRPVVVRCTGEDQTPQEIPVGKQTFAQVADTVAALEPLLIEALDAKGDLIRAFRPDDGDEPSASANAPRIPDALTSDPETARITHFANLIHRAYEHTTDVAFDRLVSLFEAVNARAEAAERLAAQSEAARRRELKEHLEEAAQNVASGTQSDDPLTQMIGAWFQGQMMAAAQQAAATPPPTPPNGKPGKAS